MDAEEARFVTWPPMRPVEANKDKHRVAELGDVVEDAVKPRTMDIEEKLFLLLPWNSVISAVDYWNLQFPGVDLEFYFSVAYQSTNFVGLFLVVAYGSQFTFRSRVVPGFIIYFICMAVLPFFTNQGLSVGTVAVLGLVDSIVQGSIFALAGMFSGRYVAALMAGQGVAGFAVAALRIITKASLPSDDDGTKTATYIFFGVSCFFIVLCIVCFIFVLERSPVTKYFMDRTARARDAAFESSLRESDPANYMTLPPDAYPKNEYRERDGSGYQLMDESGSPSTIQNGPVVSNLAIWKKIWPFGVSIMSIFTVTLALFPGITSEMESTNDHLNPEDDKTNPDGTSWYPVIMIALFNLGDLIGRSLPNRPSFVWLGPRGVFIGTGVRFVFLPLFIMCVKGSVFTEDYWQYIIMLAFAISNGYLATLCMMFAPDVVDVHEREQAGTIMVFALTAGLTIGVWIGLLLKTLLDDGAFD